MDPNARQTVWQRLQKGFYYNRQSMIRQAGRGKGLKRDQDEGQARTSRGQGTDRRTPETQRLKVWSKPFSTAGWFTGKLTVDAGQGQKAGQLTGS